MERVFGNYRRRRERAEKLAAAGTSSEAPLRFAARLYEAQAELAKKLVEGGRALTGALEKDAEHLAAAAEVVLQLAAREGPPELARSAASGRSRAQLCAALHGADYLARAIFRPYLEILALADIPFTGGPPREGHCPFCHGRPWISSRRSPTEVDGAARLLSCAWCATEWPMNRIVCAACGETDPEKLPTFQGDAFPAARIEACETCRRYLKSIDLTVDARALPEVDDLLSLALDLWASEQGFERLEPGLAGI